MTGPEIQPKPWKRRIRRILLLTLAVLPAAVIYAALTPWSIRELWLPLVARSTGAQIRADEVALESVLPFRMRIVNFHYSDSETLVEIRSGVFQLRLRKLFRHAAVLKHTRIDGIRVVCKHPTEPPKQPEPKPAVRREQAAAPPENGADKWYFSMEDFHIRNAVVELENREKRTVQFWRAGSLEGDRFQPEVPCRVKADASVVILPDKRNPLHIRALPFQLESDYLLDSEYQLKEFKVFLRTGIMDLSVTDEIEVKPASRIQATVRIEAVCPNANSFQIRRSETQFFRGTENIGKLHFIGTFGDNFQCSGTFENLDMEPYLSILAPNAKIRLKVPQAEFTASGSDFTSEGLKSGLTARLTAKMEDISIPLELNHQNVVIRLIMIPVEAVPAFFEKVGLRWSMRDGVKNCRESLESFLAGGRNLDFDRAELDLSMEKGTLIISDLDLHGKMVEMESIHGKLEMASGKLDIATTLILAGLKIPLQFRGTLDEPEPHYENAIPAFLELNAPLLETLKSLDEPVSEKDSKLQKNLKKGYQQLNKLLNF